MGHESKIFQIHRGKDMEPQNFEQPSFIQERSKNILFKLSYSD